MQALEPVRFKNPRGNLVQLITALAGLYVQISAENLLIP
jgi:hypothetical protein